MQTIDVQGVRMIKEMDAVVLAQRRRPGGFEPDSLAAWRSIAREGGVMLDIGAYTGIYTIAAAQKLAMAIGFEANPHSYERMRQNIRINDVDAMAFNMAVSDVEGELSMRLPNGVSLTSAATVTGGKGPSFEIHAEPIDNFMFRLPVIGIKIDVERHECNVLQGAAKTISRDHPAIIIEELDKEQSAAISAILKPMGYRRQPLKQNNAIWTH